MRDTDIDLQRSVIKLNNESEKTAKNKKLARNMAL